MAIKKVWIDEGCISCGMCEELCPDFLKPAIDVAPEQV